MGVGRFRLALAAGFVAVLLGATVAEADFAWDPEATFDPPEPADLYGRAVALDAPTLVTGAPGDDTLLANAGAVWVHSRNGDGTWSLVVKLNATGAAAGEQLGAAVAVEDDTLVAGAPFADDGQGAVYVFNRSPGGLWTQSARLTPAGSPGSIGFGSAVDVAGNTIVVGAPSTGAGSVYVFNADGGGVWSQTQELVPADAASGDLVGTDVALSGDTILIGASLEGTAGTSAGAAYAFVRDGGGTWSQQAKLFASDAAAGDLFGDAVELLADVAIIGARGNDDAGSGSGSAYVFTRSPSDIWSQQIKLTPSNGTAAGLFGAALSFDGTHLIVGAPGTGTAHAFESPTWPETSVLSNGLLFGGDVAVDGEALAIATQDVASGTVEVYRRSEALLPPPEPVGVFDPIIGEWSIADDAGSVATFFYGNPGDLPLVGDWDCDGDDTVGLYRESTGYVFLRNSLSAGFADLEFFFGQDGDKVIASDWDDDGTDTVSIYRPGEARFYITNTNATGFAEIDFRFGSLNLLPVAGVFVS